MIPKVSVCVIVYNHSQYILECLNGIYNQICDFDFEVIIHDDASTDGCAELIRNFVTSRDAKNFLYNKNTSNKGMMVNLTNALKKCKGEYVAFCEGDDFWTDNFKLQKQISLMEQDPTCTISVHPAYLYRTSGDNASIGFDKGKIVHNFSLKDVLMSNGQFAPTASYIVRKDVLDNLPEWFVDAPIGDFFIEIFSLFRGTGLYCPDVMCSYRIFSTGSWSDQFRRGNGQKMINFGKQMCHCFDLIEADFCLPNHSVEFNYKKSSACLSSAIGNLLQRDFEQFKYWIEISCEIYWGSSATQKVLFFFRRFPKLCLLLFEIKAFLYLLLRYK